MGVEGSWRMGRLSEAKLGTVRLLIEQAPDSTLRSLESALAASSGQDELGDIDRKSVV